MPAVSVPRTQALTDLGFTAGICVFVLGAGRRTAQQIRVNDSIFIFSTDTPTCVGKKIITALSLPVTVLYVSQAHNAELEFLAHLPQTRKLAFVCDQSV